MSLPGIIAPPGTPLFLAAGHAIKELSVYAQVKPQVGHSRARRVRTIQERIVSVSWFLEAQQLADVHEWYETTLHAGALQFSARVQVQGAGQAWWRARWMDFQIEMLNLGRGRVFGRLFLDEGPFDAGPDLSTLAAEILAPLAGASTPTIPATLAAEISVALDGLVDETS